MEISFDKHSIFVDEQRQTVRSAAFHYFRLPGQDTWLDRLEKIKVAGYNAVDIYFPWGFHSEEKGVYDFTGIKDIRRLLELTVDLDLLVVARPGPYINAEISAGGLPFWLLAEDDIVLRNRDNGDFKYSHKFMKYVREWYSRIIPILNEYSNVIAFQVENEYSTNEAEPDYIQELYHLAREFGIKAPILHNDTYCAGLYSDVVDIYAFDTYPTMNFDVDWRKNSSTFDVIDNAEENFDYFHENSPLYVAEMQAGWLDKWGGKGYENIRNLLSSQHINIITKTAVSQGITMFNHYMGVGGISWGTLPCNEVYTSYDFAAPIKEDGTLGENYFAAKRINYFLQSFNLAHTEKVDLTGILSDELPQDIFAVLRNDLTNDCSWLFARNMNQHDVNLETVYGNLNLKPFDMKILPINLNLYACKIEFSSFEIFASTGNEQVQNVFLLRDDRAWIDVSGVVVKTSGLSCSKGEKVTINANNCENLSYVSFEKDGKVTNLIFLDTETADKSWMVENQVFIGADMLNYPNKAGFLAPGELISVINKDMFKPHNVEFEVSEPEIKIENIQFISCAPEIDNEYDYSDWQKLGGKLDCITNRIFDEFIWYKTSFSGKLDSIEISAKHNFAIYLNEVEVFSHFTKSPASEKEELMTIEIPEGVLKDKNYLSVLVQNLGFNKGYESAPDLSRGILRFNTAPHIDLKWRIRGGLTPEVEEWSYSSEQDEITTTQNCYLEWINAYVEIEDSASVFSPKYLILDEFLFKSANIYLNGFKIGTYNSEIGPQNEFILPEGFLKNNNVLSFLVWHMKGRNHVIEDYKSDRKNVNIKIRHFKRFYNIGLSEILL